MPHSHPSLKTLKETQLPYLLSCLRVDLALEQGHSKLYFFGAVGLHGDAEVTQMGEEAGAGLALCCAPAPSPQPGWELRRNSWNSRLSTGICASPAAPLFHIHRDATALAICFFFSPSLPSLQQPFRSSQQKAERNNKLIVYQLTSTYAKHSLRS